MAWLEFKMGVVLVAFHGREASQKTFPPPTKKRNNGQLQDASMRQGHKSNTVVALYQVQLVILILLLSSAVFSYMLLDFVPDGLLNLFFF